MYRRPARFFIALSLASISANCAPSTDTATDELASSASDRFSAEDRRIARALSIGNNSTLDNANDPYDQALMCGVAIDFIAQAFESSTGLESAQRQAIKLARNLFAQRLYDLGRSRGKSRIEIERDRARKATDIPEDGTKAQIAIGCIQRLQNGESTT